MSASEVPPPGAARKSQQPGIPGTGQTLSQEPGSGEVHDDCPLIICRMFGELHNLEVRIMLCI